MYNCLINISIHTYQYIYIYICMTYYNIMCDVYKSIYQKIIIYKLLDLLVFFRGQTFNIFRDTENSKFTILPSSASF